MMDVKCNLTLAICMYNAERYVEETLESVIAQTMQNFYLLIVDDCCTDNSVEVVERFFLRYPRQYDMVHFEKNKGLSAGRRYVEEHAFTKYILFVDADDCPYPTLVEKLYNKISSDTDLMAVGCYLEYMDSKGGKMKGGIFLGERTKENFYKKARKEKLIFMQPTAIYDRYLALQVGGHNITGFPEGKPRYQDYCEDLDLWTRMSDLYKKGKAIVVIPEVLCRYRKHQAAMSVNSIGMILRMRHIKINLKRRRRGEQELSFVEFLEHIGPQEYRKLEKNAIAADCLRQSYYLFKSGRAVDGLRNLLKSIKNNPLYIINKIKHNLLR